MPSAEQRPHTDEMVVVHRVFRRESALLPRLVRAVEDGDTGRAALIADFTDRPTSPRVTRSDPLLHCPVRINQPPQLS
ncbi:hypothetical protein ACFYX4_40200, partial [Streptomyces sp. NPDC002328]